ncbi:MAG: hypothetical protein WBP93_15225, partial [Pyrinomonadaceae bacterium]
ADTPEEFVAAIEAAMVEDHQMRLRRVDDFLAETSWDHTWGRMRELIEDVIASRRVVSAQPVVLKAAARAASSGEYATGD